jgi:hypothetical protein
LRKALQGGEHTRCAFNIHGCRFAPNGDTEHCGRGHHLWLFTPPLLLLLLLVVLLPWLLVLLLL